jgi:hypothetical protein
VAGMSVDSFDEVCTPGGAGGSFDRIDAPVE